MIDGGEQTDSVCVNPHSEEDEDTDVNFLSGGFRCDIAQPDSRHGGDSEVQTKKIRSLLCQTGSIRRL